MVATGDFACPRSAAARQSIPPPAADARKSAEGIRDVKVSNHALDWTAADKRAVDLVRVLAMDAVQKVGNGHPGTAMCLAPAAYLLYQRVLRHDPADPKWPGRDRFVLSCGHSVADALHPAVPVRLRGSGSTT